MTSPLQTPAALVCTSLFSLTCIVNIFNNFDYTPTTSAHTHVHACTHTHTHTFVLNNNNYYIVIQQVERIQYFREYVWYNVLKVDSIFLVVLSHKNISNALIKMS